MATFSAGDKVKDTVTGREGTYEKNVKDIHYAKSSNGFRFIISDEDIAGLPKPEVKQPNLPK